MTLEYFTLKSVSIFQCILRRAEHNITFTNFVSCKTFFSISWIALTAFYFALYLQIAKYLSAMNGMEKEKNCENCHYFIFLWNSMVDVILNLTFSASFQYFKRDSATKYYCNKYLSEKTTKWKCANRISLLNQKLASLCHSLCVKSKYITYTIQHIVIRENTM